VKELTGHFDDFGDLHGCWKDVIRRKNLRSTQFMRL